MSLQVHPDGSGLGGHGAAAAAAMGLGLGLPGHAGGGGGAGTASQQLRDSATPFVHVRPRSSKFEVAFEPRCAAAGGLRAWMT